MSNTPDYKPTEYGAFVNAEAVAFINELVASDNKFVIATLDDLVIGVAQRAHNGIKPNFGREAAIQLLAAMIAKGFYAPAPWRTQEATG